MLTSEQLANLVDSITPAYSAYEQDIARKLCKAIERIADRNEALSEWHKSYMQEAERLYKEIQEQTKALTAANEGEIAGTLATAANKSIEFDQAIYRAAGRTALELSEMPSARRLLLAGIDKTNGLIGNLTKTTAKTAHDIFISACSTAEMQVTSGAFDYNTAIRNAIKQASGDGRYITYPSGHRDSVDVAVRRAVLTGISQTTGLLSIYHAQEMDCDLMQISAHYGARPEHAEWQGKIVSLSGFTVGYLTLEDIGYGAGEGFKGWNCRHDWYPYYEGISVNQYSDEQLDEYANKLVYYDGNYIPYYEATQMVRRQERRIRKLSREAAGLDTKYTAAELEQKKQLLKQHRKTLKDFCEQTGLTARPQSMRAIGSSNKTFLTKQEEAAIAKYVSSESYGINHALRNGIPLHSDLKTVVNNLDSALNKLPDYRGTVYRSLSSEYIEDLDVFNTIHKAENIVQYGAFTSASKSVYDETMDIQLVIISKHGKDISKWNQNENEVLFKRDSLFYVVKRDSNTIYLEEM